MKNRKIVFANQKGGVGKSTLCILFANYLAWKGKSVCIIDTDLQKTILMQRQKDTQIYEDWDEPYNVQDFDVTDPETMQQLMDSAAQVDGYVLFDSPGNISEDGLAPLFVDADFIVCPYEYEDKTLEFYRRFRTGSQTPYANITHRCMRKSSSFRTALTPVLVLLTSR